MKYTRRRFIKAGLAGLGGLTLGSSFLLSACEKSPRFYDPYKIISLGKTGIKTTRLCMGTGIFGGGGESNLTRLGFESGIKLVQDIYERGVRMFDCADSYGSHFVIGKALKNKKRTDYTIFTKVWFQGVNDLDINKTVERFLKELQTDYLDGLLLHCVTTPDWNTANSKLLESIDKLKEKGIIRSHGLSCHSLDALKTAAEESWVDTCHIRINPFGVKMDGNLDDVFPIAKKIHNSGKGVIGMKLYGEGEFAGDAEKKDQSLRFALQSGVVDVLNLGMDKMSDLIDTEERIKKIAILE